MPGCVCFLVPVGLTLHQYNPRTTALKQRELYLHKNHAALQREHSQITANIVIQTVHDFLFCMNIFNMIKQSPKGTMALVRKLIPCTYTLNEMQ